MQTAAFFVPKENLFSAAVLVFLAGAAGTFVIAPDFRNFALERDCDLLLRRLFLLCAGCIVRSELIKTRMSQGLREGFKHLLKSLKRCRRTEHVRQDFLIDFLHQRIEHLERFLLVFHQRVFLRIGAEPDA